MAPPIFKQLSYEQARDAAAAEKKWLLVDFSAEWCQPCKHMDRTTWVAPEVVAWVNEHAVAIQLDGDHSPLAQELSVQAYPTLIIFDGERELDRTSGARPAAALLSWLDGLKSGRTELDELRDTPKSDLRGQLQLASSLVEKGHDLEALEVFAWLWEHSLEVEPAWVGVRSSFLINELEPLLARFEPARIRFERFRDAAKSRGGEAIHDFVVLNYALGEEDRTLDWLRGATPSEAQAVRLHGDPRIRQLVDERGELTLFAKLIADPLAALEAEQKTLENIRRTFPADFPAEMIRHAITAIESNRDAFAELLVRALRAAGRTEEAVRVEARASELKN
jgi:thiol-disulfide isomerase/thioredoxin